MPDDSSSTVTTLFTGGSIVFVGEILGLGLSFLSALVIGRLLGPERYGVITLAATVITASSTFVLLGMHTGVGRFLPRYDEEAYRRGVLVSAFQLVVPISLLVGLSVTILAEFIARQVFSDPALIPVLRLFGIAIPIAAIEKLSVGGIQGLQLTAPKIYIENIAAHGTRLVFAATVLALGYSTLGVAWAYFLGYAVAAGLGLYYLHHRTTLFSGGEAVSMHRTLLAFSAPLIISAVMSKVLADIDTFLLGYYVSTADVGIYNVVYPISTLLTVILSSFSFIFLPVISELHTDERLGEMKRMYQVVTKWIFMLSLQIFVVLTIFPEMAIGLTFGSEYVPGAPALAILAFGFFTHALAGPDYSVLTSIGETRLIMYDNVMAALVNLVLNVALIPQYSYVGAAVATTLAYLGLNVAYSIQLYQRTGIHPFSAALVKPAVLIAPVVVGLYSLTRVVEVTVPAFIGLMVGFLCVYGLFVVRFGGIESEEVELVQSTERRFDVDLGPVKNVLRRLS